MRPPMAADLLPTITGQLYRKRPQISSTLARCDCGSGLSMKVEFAMYSRPLEQRKF
ncbi:hypothetical protein BDR05DRAFT_962486 [Suillus weaverae]|nr:hypothetical protein BDR05DRAFT_962486 [Suillus weaverae]